MTERMLDILITSRTRRKLVAFFVLNEWQSFYLRQLAQEINEAVHATRLEILNLIKSGLIFASGTGRQKYYQINPHCFYLNEIRSLVQKMKKTGYKEFSFTDHARKEMLEKNLSRVTSALIIKYDPQKIILFGSLASGNVNESSDIDLLIIKDTQKPYFDRIREVTGLCDYNVGIDFLIYNPRELKEAFESRPFFRKEIIKKGKVLYEKGA